MTKTATVPRVPAAGVAGLQFEEKCICDLCECGYHRCPPVAATASEYSRSFVEKPLDDGGGDASAPIVLGQARADNLVVGGENGFGRVVGGSMAYASTHRVDFRPWPTQHIDAVRPVEEYIPPSGSFADTSTHRADFTRKEIDAEKPSPAHRPTSAATTAAEQRFPGEEAPFDAISTHQADFDRKIVEPPQPVRPASVLYKTNAPLEATTTHQQDYRVFTIRTPPTVYRPKDSRHLSEEPFNAISEHRANFVERPDAEPAQLIRPKTGAFDERSGGVRQPMQLSSTYREGFTDKLAERDEVAPHADQRHESRDTPFFIGAATRRAASSVVVAAGDARWRPCPAELVLTHKDRSYQRTGLRNGHIIYHRVVGRATPDAVRYRRMSPVV